MLANNSMNKILFWKTCVFSSLYIFILSNLFPVFHTHTHTHTYTHTYIYMNKEKRTYTFNLEKQKNGYSIKRFSVSWMASKSGSEASGCPYRERAGDDDAKHVVIHGIKFRKAKRPLYGSNMFAKSFLFHVNYKGKEIRFLLDTCTVCTGTPPTHTRSILWPSCLSPRCRRWHWLWASREVAWPWHTSARWFHFSRR